LRKPTFKRQLNHNITNMKKLAAILCVSALATGAFAQGLINFFNAPGFLISNGGPDWATGGTSISGGTFYFGLLSAPAGTTDRTAFTFSGVYGTNQATAGRFTGGGNVAISGWAAGATRAFFVAGWSSDLGHDFNPAWLTGVFPGASQGFFGASQIASGRAGGFDGTGTVPNLAPFTAGTIASGFNLVPIPEPATVALAGLGAAALLIFRRRK
jgi:hypothetical protein